MVLRNTGHQRGALLRMAALSAAAHAARDDGTTQLTLRADRCGVDSDVGHAIRVMHPRSESCIRDPSHASAIRVVHPRSESCIHEQSQCLG